MNNRKKEYDPSKDMNKPQSGTQPEAAPFEKPTPPPSFREIYEQSPHLNSVIVPIGKLLGYGPHSDVYLGELTGSGQSVTIKVDRRPIRSTNKMRSQFQTLQRKVTRFKGFKHPGMAELIDWIPDWKNNCSYIIMRYIEGKGLNQALADRRTFSQKQVLNWTFQLLDVMEYLHGQRCIIGDLDASNIVLTPDNKRVCLVDFKYLSDMKQQLRPQESIEGQPFGLYKEADNEALAEGIREDIRNLGQTLFELLSGTKPEILTPEGTPTEASADSTPEGTSSDAMRKKLSDRGVSDSVADVILRAMLPEPGEGYQSAADIRRALQELPAKDKQTSFQMFALAGGVLLTIAMLAIGAFSVWKGLYQSNRYAEMTIAAGNSAKALESGAYSKAFDLADSATQLKDDNDPPCAPEAQAALAAAMSVYDYVRGYKPFSNFKLNGTPVQARFSPDGSRIAVLVKTGHIPPRNEIHILETRSGKSLVGLPASDSSASDFLFFDNDSLFYAGKGKASGTETTLCYSVSQERNIFEGSERTSGESRSVSVALSDNRKVAASLFQGDSVAYLYDVDAILSGGQGELVHPVEIRDASTGDAVSDSLTLASSAQMSNFLALNANGEYLALNFPDGGVGMYYLPSGQESVYYELLDESDYVRFEGGFFQDYFFYAASTSDDLSALVPFQGALYRLDANGPQLQLRRSATLPIHIQANETGIYFSLGNALYHADTDALNWKFLAEADNSIQLLRHAAGRLLAVTDKGLVLVYREDGAWKVETAHGPFNVAGLSERYVFLASGKEKALSVLEWKERGVTALAYNPGEEELRDYKQHYEHVGAHISADGQTAILFRSTGFRIYRLSDGERIDPDADAEETKFDDLAQTLIYQREPRLSDDPESECLKVIGTSQVSFYSTKTGEPLYSRDVRADDDIPVFITRSYRVQQKSDGDPVKIFRGKSDKQLLTELNEGTLTHASQQGDCLIVCFRTGDNLQRSLLLDKNLDVIAELPEPCEALPEGAVLPTPSDSGTPDATNDAFPPYGTLVFDDMQGHLLQGPLYTLEGLRALAINWRMETG